MWYRLRYKGTVEVPLIPLYKNDVIRVGKLNLDGLTYIVYISPEFGRASKKLRRGIQKCLNMPKVHFGGYRNSNWRTGETIIYTNSKQWYGLMSANKLHPTIGDDASPKLVIALVKYLKHYDRSGTCQKT